MPDKRLHPGLCYDRNVLACGHDAYILFNHGIGTHYEPERQYCMACGGLSDVTEREEHAVKGHYAHEELR